ncbi:class II lanthipeptide, LchA2/BrtA2 family [Streptomyces sp. NPDC001118]|uniref:class II lanthipeptide, LchA2/BrtA2 family n=1 Tax=Streptomyces sp. NPDC002589 TaxID=3154420 RepID=UPI00331DDFB5
MEKTDLLGAYDELDLIELGNDDAQAGTDPVDISIAATAVASAAWCPTTKCTSKC